MQWPVNLSCGVMNKIRVCLVDDEQRALETHAKVIHNFLDNVEISGTASTVEEAYKMVVEVKPDLLLLDIEMGKESGFQLLERFDEIDFHVAFITAHEEYALRAIKFSAIDYIIKPASVSDIKALMSKVEQSKINFSSSANVKQMIGNFHTAEKGEHKISISVADGYEFIKVNDILYLLADGSYTHLCLKNGNRITTSKNLKFFESILDDYAFFRIHNSTLINTKYIQRILKTAGGSVLMENGEEFSIAKSRKDDFLSLLALK